MYKGEEGVISFADFKKAIWMKRIGSSNDLVKIPEVTKGADVSEKYIYPL